MQTLQTPARKSTGAVVTVAIARAAGQDAGNRSMKAGGRTAWNRDDWNAACDAMADLMAMVS